MNQWVSRRPNMHRRRISAVLVTLLALGTVGCRPDVVTRSERPEQATVRLTFELELNPHVYEDSMWGDPPQLALWIENDADGSIRMVQVTHRTATGDWEGKVECSVALPYWVSYYNRQTGAEGGPTWENPAVNAITCATPRTRLHTDIEVPRGTCWTCFVEVNASGDFNAAFPRFSQAGYSDRYGNGQPSVIYEGSIEAVEGATNHPEPIGRTDQYEPVEHLSDLQGITTAKELIRSVKISCVSVAAQPEPQTHPE